MFSYGKIDATVPDVLIHKARIAIQTQPSERQSAIVRTPVCHRPDTRASDIEIADLASTVWTPAYHGPDARTTDMEIAF